MASHGHIDLWACLPWSCWQVVVAGNAVCNNRVQPPTSWHILIYDIYILIMITVCSSYFVFVRIFLCKSLSSWNLGLLIVLISPVIIHSSTSLIFRSFSLWTLYSIFWQLNFFFFIINLSQDFSTVPSELGLGSFQLITSKPYIILCFKGNFKSLAQESHSGLNLRELSLKSIFIPHKVQIWVSLQFMLEFVKSRERWVHKTKFGSEFSL